MSHYADRINMNSQIKSQNIAEGIYQEMSFFKKKCLAVGNGDTKSVTFKFWVHYLDVDPMLHNYESKHLCTEINLAWF